MIASRYDIITDALRDVVGDRAAGECATAACDAMRRGETATDAIRDEVRRRKAFASMYGATWGTALPDSLALAAELAISKVNAQERTATLRSAQHMTRRTKR